MKKLISAAKGFFRGFLTWIREVIPWSLNVGMVVYNYLAYRMQALKDEKTKVELEKKYLENQNAVEEANRGKSDADIVRDAIDEGRGLK